VLVSGQDEAPGGRAGSLETDSSSNYVKKER
jgi:hypothetical protein